MYVIKRDGRPEKVHFDKITSRIKKLCYGLNEIVDPIEVSQKVAQGLKSGITTTELDELSAETAAYMSARHSHFSSLAARIAISNLHKNTEKNFMTVITRLRNYIEPKTGEPAPLISDKVFNFISNNQERLCSAIVHDRDGMYDYFGFKTLERSYLLKINGKVTERPQHMLMRVACGIHAGEIEANVEEAIETYNLLSGGWFTHATPTLYNAGTPRPQLSSCFLLTMKEDSIEGIYDTLKQCALISKDAGGIGLAVHDIRATGAYIKGTNGTSNGLIPMLRVFNNSARYVDQGGGKRKGAFAVYLEPHHLDIFAFLDLKKNQGDQESRCRDLFLGLWVSDLFMKRVKADGNWSLFCPSNTRLLSQTWGKKFERLYLQYEKQGKAVKIVKAQDLWFKILDAETETGNPYMLYKDACNRKSNQQNLGTIKSSNLCVAPETMILTRKGYYPIASLEGQEVQIWNGEAWSKVKIVKTGENKPLVKVTLSDGTFIECTPYHKFIIKSSGNACKQPNISNSKRVDASDLKIGVKLIKWNLPKARKGLKKQNISYPYTHGLFCADGTYHQNYKGEKIIPGISLYGEKKKLIDYIDVRSTSGKEDKAGKINVLLPLDLAPKFHVPINAGKKTRLRWLEGYLDGDGCVIKNKSCFGIQAVSINGEFLRKIQLLLQTLGVFSKIRPCKKEGKELMPDHKGGEKEYNVKASERLLISGCEVYKLLLLGFSPKRLTIVKKVPSQENIRYTTVEKVEDEKRMADTYCFTEEKTHAGVFNGQLFGNCSEILEYTSPEEVAVCNLASIALPMFVIDGKFDHKRLFEVTKTITKNLNKVIDINYYPIKEAETSNLRHRPIGIGVQGLADAFILLRYPFDSPEALQLNKEIFETMYFAALTASMELAKKDGPYQTYKGSPMSKGLFQFDLWSKEILEKEGKIRQDDDLDREDTKEELERIHEHSKQYLSGKWNWDGLRQEILTHGTRNSLLIAPMPTASTSQILGSNPSFEPYINNIYVHRTLAGEFVCVNRHLLSDLIKLGLWNPILKNKLIKANGSVQNIPEIPKNIKDLYKTVWEISQKVIIDMAADRGVFIDQSQSMNIHMKDVNYGKLTSMHFHAWEKGLKTGLYYLRTKPATDATKFTVDEVVLKIELEEEKKRPLLDLPEKAKPLALTSSTDSVSSLSSIDTSETSSTSPLTSPIVVMDKEKQQREAIMCSLKNRDECESCGS